jgi:hypothetical protein
MQSGYTDRLLASSPAAVTIITSALQKAAARSFSILNVKTVGIHSEGHHNQKNHLYQNPKT